MMPFSQASNTPFHIRNSSTIVDLMALRVLVLAVLVVSPIMGAVLEVKRCNPSTSLAGSSGGDAAGTPVFGALAFSDRE
jgi:hypothetical protein